MAQFQTDLTPAKGEGAQALSPVAPVDYSGAAKVIGSVFDNIGRGNASQVKAERQALEDAVVGEFVRESLTLKDAFTTGGMTAAEVNTRSRAIYSKYAAAYPHLTESLSKANTNIKGDSGLGESFDFEAAADAADKAELAAMRNAGIYIGPDQDQATIERSKEAYRKSVRAEDEFKKMTARSSERRAQASEDRAAEDYADKKRAAGLLADLGASEQRRLIDTVASLTNRAQNGEDPKTLLLELANQKSRLNQGLNTIAATHPDLAGPYRTMFTEITTFAEAAIKGEIDSATYENKVKNLINQAALVGLADPKTRALAATQKLVPNSDVLAFMGAQVGVETHAAIVRGISGQPGIDIISSPEATKAAAMTISQGLNDLRKGREDTRNDTKNLINSTLKQVGAADFLNMKPEQLNEVSSFIASPDFAYALENGLVDPANMESAKRIVQYRYQQPVVSSIVEKMSDTLNLGFNQPDVNVSDVVDLQTVGDKITLAISPEVQDRGVAETLRANLKTSQVALNQVVRMAAHLEGRTDYAKYWEENRHNIMPDLYLEPSYVGAVVNGYEYLGGNTRNKRNWLFVGESDRSKSGKIK